MESHLPRSVPFRISLAEIDEIHFGRGRNRSFDLEQSGATKRLIIQLADPWWSQVHARLLRIPAGSPSSRKPSDGPASRPFSGSPSSRKPSGTFSRPPSGTLSRPPSGTFPRSDPGDGYRYVVEDAGSRNGTLVNGVRVARKEITDGDILELGHVFFLFRESIPETGPIITEVNLEGTRAPAWATVQPSFSVQLEELWRHAPSAISILIQGEPGTGKKVAARMIHSLSKRTGDFVTVDCGAVSQDRAEIELLGYAQGAFDGSEDDSIGLIRRADKGTLLLSAIDDLPSHAQAILLRVLEQREVVPAGGSNAFPVDFRVISVANKSLLQMVQTGSFRADLLARLAAHTIELWPLRRRREDMGVIIAELLSRLVPPDRKGPDVRFEPRVMRALLQYSWPKNVHELLKVLTASLDSAGEGEVALHHFPAAIQEVGSGAPSSKEVLHRRDQLVALLRRFEGNIGEVARAMGRDRDQIKRWMSRYDLDPTVFKR